MPQSLWFLTLFTIVRHNACSAFMVQKCSDCTKFSSLFLYFTFTCHSQLFYTTIGFSWISQIQNVSLSIIHGNGYFFFFFLKTLLILLINFVYYSRFLSHKWKLVCKNASTWNMDENENRVASLLLLDMGKEKENRIKNNINNKCCTKALFSSSFV